MPKINVKVKLFATLRRYAESESAQKPFEIELSKDASLKDLVNSLGIPPEETKTIFINGLVQELDSKLEDGDEVGIFPPIAGG